MSNELIHITLEGEEDKISVYAFLKTVRATMKVLTEVGIESGERGEWFVGKTSHNSPMHFEIVGSGVEGIVKTFMEGMELLETAEGNNRVRPRHFNDNALVGAKSLVSVLNSGITRLDVYSDSDEHIRLTQRIAAASDYLKTPTSFETVTELEGRLERVDIHGHAEFGLYDPLFSSPIECSFDAKDAEQIGSILSHRLRVTGNARFSSRTGRPIAISVEKWEKLPDDNELPQIEDLHKARLNLTGGHKSEDIIAELRLSNG